MEDIYKEVEKKLNVKISGLNVLKSGWAGEILSVSLSESRNKYIIKTYNSSKKGIKNIKREWSGLTLLYNAKYPVPKPITKDFLSETPYIVMEQIEGEDLWTYYESASKEDRANIIEDFMKLFYRLHTLDIAITNEKIIDNSTKFFIESELNEINELIAENNLTCFSKLINWIQREKNNVKCGSLSIIHRDYHPWNVIIDKRKNLYVFDLLWGIGDYRFDLAWFCALMERSGFNDFSCKALKAYKKLRKEDISDFDFFKVLATLRWLINILISLKTGENLNETRKKEFENFIRPLMENAFKEIKYRTNIDISY